MDEFKNAIGILAVLLTFIGYVPYIRDVLKGKTIPHVYSWFLWTFVTSIAFALQFTGGGGAGTFVTLAASLMCLTVFVLGYLKHGKKEITKIDTLFFVLAFISLGLWLIAKQPIISAILVTATDLLGFAPTIRKSWNKPHAETFSFYFLNSLRFVLAVIALRQYTIVTALYPISWIFGNGLFALFLLLRKKQLSYSQQGSL